MNADENVYLSKKKHHMRFTRKKVFTEFNISSFAEMREILLLFLQPVSPH
jgi:hypothetical protein